MQLEIDVLVPLDSPSREVKGVCMRVCVYGWEGVGVSVRVWGRQIGLGDRRLGAGQVRVRIVGLSQKHLSARIKALPEAGIHFTEQIKQTVHKHSRRKGTVR